MRPATSGRTVIDSSDRRLPTAVIVCGNAWETTLWLRPSSQSLRPRRAFGRGGCHSGGARIDRGALRVPARSRRRRQPGCQTRRRRLRRFCSLSEFSCLIRGFPRPGRQSVIMPCRRFPRQRVFRRAGESKSDFYTRAVSVLDAGNHVATRCFTTKTAPMVRFRIIARCDRIRRHGLTGRNWRAGHCATFPADVMSRRSAAPRRRAIGNTVDLDRAGVQVAPVTRDVDRCRTVDVRTRRRRRLRRDVSLSKPRPGDAFAVSPGRSVQVRVDVATRTRCYDAAARHAAPDHGLGDGRADAERGHHPAAMNATPPNGVTIPMRDGAPSASAYRLPEKSAMPATKSHAARRSARLSGTVQHQYADAEQSERVPRVIVDRRLPDRNRFGRHAGLQCVRAECPECDGGGHQ